MNLQNTRQLPVGQAIAWAALHDTGLLQSAIPGCESLTKTGDNRFEVVLVAAIGPVRARFKGHLEMFDLVEPTSYKLKFEGSGGAAGHGKGHAEVRLEPVDASTTLLHYTAQASVGGKLAHVGSRLVEMASNKIAADFFNKFEEYLQAQRPAEPEGHRLASSGGWLHQFLGALGKMFARVRHQGRGLR